MFFVHTSIDSALSVILYFLVVWLGAIFSSHQIAVIFGDENISKCSYNLFLVVERTNWTSLNSFTDLQCLSGVVFKELCDHTIGKCISSRRTNL